MHTVQVCGDFTGAAFGQVVVLPVLEQDKSTVQTVQISVKIPHAQFLAMVDVPVVVQRQVLWSKVCRTLFGSSQLQFLDKVVDMLVIVQRQVLGETEQKTVEVPQLQHCRGRPVLGQVVDTPAGVQRHVRGPDCAENRGVSAVAALGRVCPG